MKITLKTELNGKETISKLHSLKLGLMTRILENMIVLYSLRLHLNTIFQAITSITLGRDLTTRRNHYP